MNGWKLVREILALRMRVLDVHVIVLRSDSYQEVHRCVSQLASETTRMFCIDGIGSGCIC